MRSDEEPGRDGEKTEYGRRVRAAAGKTRAGNDQALVNEPAWVLQHGERGIGRAATAVVAERDERVPCVSVRDGLSPRTR